MRKRRKEDNLISPGKKKGLFSRIFDGGRRKLTVMFIPHSEEKVVNFQISFFSLAFSVLILVGLVFSFFWYSANYSGKAQQLAANKGNLREQEASLEVVRQEVDALVKVAGSFNQTLGRTLSALGIDDSEGSMARSAGDLSSFFNTIETDAKSQSEVGDLKKLSASLDSAIKPLDEITDVLLAQRALLTDIPTLWPLKGVRGRVTAPYGPGIHPFSGEWYLHKGLDLGYGMGTAIVATANGKVVTRDYEEFGLGNYVMIQHKFGFYTRYAHMQNVYVREGQEVKQGDIIGTMGNSGLSSGPHLHYEVRIGAQVLDPAKFINMTDSAYDVVKYTDQGMD